MKKKLAIISVFIKASKSYMSYENNRARFWIEFPRAFIRFLWFSRRDAFWK